MMCNKIREKGKKMDYGCFNYTDHPHAKDMHARNIKNHHQLPRSIIPW